MKEFANASVSSNSFPLLANQSGLFKKIINMKSVEEAREKLLMLNVFYTDIAYTHISEWPKWNVVMLLSNFGGQLGLFVGMSMLSFLEFVDLFFKIIFYFFKKRKQV